LKLKGSLAPDAPVFRVVEGFNEWVSMEPTDLSRMIEKRIPS
jgi:hypothetical protein